MISRLRLQNFLGTAHRDVQLSPRVTLITGGNGVGKTTILEALIWTLWGQRLRPGALAVGCETELEFDGGILERKVTPQGERVRLAGGNWQQKTKILSELEALFGAHESWSRSLHLTGRSVGSFAQGTPSYRWDHLVKLTQAGLYDKAIERARKDQLIPAENQLFAGQSAVLQAGNRELAQGAQWVGYWQNAPATPESALLDLAKVHQILSETQARITRGSAALPPEQDKLPELRKAALLANIAVEQAIRMAEASVIPQVCPACSQSLGASRSAEAYEALGVAQRALAEAQSAAVEQQSKISDYRSRLQNLQYQERNQLNLIQKLEDGLALYETHQVGALQRLMLILEAQDDATDAVQALSVLEAAVLHAKHVISTLKDSRMIYLTSFVSQINQRTRTYQELIGSRAMVSLLPQPPNGLELVTEGTGAENYKQCSGGEQRRIDLCLALAMSEAASRIGNVTQAVPLVVDEAFDTLDEAGMGALLSLACHISQRRQVILVSHVLPDLPLSADVLHVPLAP